MNLEAHLATWRQAMQAAGIGPGERRDELESHLRDGFEQRVSAGMSEEAAFAAAVERLGQGPALKREYDSAVSWRKRLWQFARRPIDPFPTNLRFTAWCSLSLVPMLIVSALQSAVEFIGLVRSGKAGGQPFLVEGLATLFCALVAVHVLHVSLRYLRRPAFSSALQLAGFWMTIFWNAGASLTVAYLTDVNRGIPIGARWTMVTIAASGTVAVLIFRRWKRCLRAKAEAALIADVSPSLS